MLTLSIFVPRLWNLVIVLILYCICDTLSTIVLLSSIGSLNFNSGNKDVFFIFVIYSTVSVKILDSFVLYTFVGMFLLLDEIFTDVGKQDCILTCNNIYL